MIVGKVLHSFNKQLSELTPDDISAASALIKTAANTELGVDLSTSDITTALNDVQKGSDVIAATGLFKASKEKQAVTEATAAASASVPSATEVQAATV